MIQSKRFVLTLMAVFFLLVLTPSTLSQVPANGVHPYGGTQDGNQTGTFTGSINDGQVSMSQETTQIIREHRIFQRSNVANSLDFIIDPSPFQIGDIDSSKSKTRVEVYAYTSSSSQTSDTRLVVIWVEGANVLHQISNCDVSEIGILIPGGATAGAAGAGESRLVCDLDSYRESTFTLSSQLANNLGTSSPVIGVTVWQTEVVNITRPGNSGTVTGNVSGTSTGTYNGEHRGEIEQINATATFNETEIQNLTATNLTFSNIFGAIQIEEIDFWFPILFWLFIMLMAWGRGWILTGFIALAGFLVEFAPPDQQEWTRITSLILLVLSFSLEFAVEKFRLRKANEEQMV